MKQRIDIIATQPEAYKAMSALESYLKNSALSPIHKELIKIRASQINGCAFCINMHTADARKAGETEQRIYLVNAWRETDLFTEEEKAILALTEEVTLIQNHVSDETYVRAAALFDETYLSQIIMAIITINAWNRLAITGRKALPKAPQD
jgi:AhpD family alkylhydroperoxidase